MIYGKQAFQIIVLSAFFHSNLLTQWQGALTVYVYHAYRKCVLQKCQSEICSSENGNVFFSLEVPDRSMSVGNMSVGIMSVWSFGNIKIEYMSIGNLLFKVNFRTPLGVNFTNILLAHLRQYSCSNKKFNLYCKHKKVSRETLVQKAACKMLVKLTPGWKRKCDLCTFQLIIRLCVRVR